MRFERIKIEKKSDNHVRENSEFSIMRSILLANFSAKSTSIFYTNQIIRICICHTHICISIVNYTHSKHISFIIRDRKYRKRFNGLIMSDFLYFFFSCNNIFAKRTCSFLNKTMYFFLILKLICRFKLIFSLKYSLKNEHFLCVESISVNKLYDCLKENNCTFCHIFLSTVKKTLIHDKTFELYNLPCIRMWKSLWLF